MVCTIICIVFSFVQHFTAVIIGGWLYFRTSEAWTNPYVPLGVELQIQRAGKYFWPLWHFQTYPPTTTTLPTIQTVQITTTNSPSTMTTTTTTTTTGNTATTAASREPRPTLSSFTTTALVPPIRWFNGLDYSGHLPCWVGVNLSSIKTNHLIQVRVSVGTLSCAQKI